MFPCIHMLDFYDSICRDASEVMVLDCDMLRVRLHLWGYCERNHILIV